MDNLEKQLKRVSIPVGSLVDLRSKILKSKDLIKIVAFAVLVLFAFIIIQKIQDVGADRRLIKRVAYLTVLPEESPTIATITNFEQLKNTKFFANAKNGNKVLLFRKSDRAILYDVVANKILNIGTFSDVGIMEAIR